jgi:peptidoglycan/xylan/chitin deacetylase (PgdA/CDA1 family)
MYRGRKMRRNYNKKNNVKKARIVILFISVALFMIAFSVVLAQKFSKDDQVVQAASNLTQNKDNAENDQSNANPDNSVNKESDSNVEDVAYLEKYIEQQEKGQKPDGADGKKVAYLTFDDGPSETVTPQILDILKSENVNATFFVIGKYAEKDDASKELVKREVAEGNAIGIHSYSHDYNYLFPNGKINFENCMSDFNKTDVALKNILGQDFSARAIRFPGGQITWSKKDPGGAEAIDKALNEKDWHQIDWNALSGDAESGHKDAEQLTQETIKTIGNREKVLLLMHDTYGKEETAKALPGIIEYLKKQGYEFKIIK